MSMRRKIEAGAERKLRGKSTPQGDKLRRMRSFYMTHLRRAKYSKELKEELVLYIMTVEDYRRGAEKHIKSLSFIEEQVNIKKEIIVAMVANNYIQAVHEISDGLAEEDLEICDFK